MSINDGGPAFPAFNHEGMSLRDYFAAHVVSALLTNTGLLKAAVKAERDRSASAAAARMAYEIADAMLKARQ